VKPKAVSYTGTNVDPILVSGRAHGHKTHHDIFFSILHDTHWVPARYPGKHKKKMGCHFLNSRMIRRQCLLESKDTMKTKWSLKLERIEV
jgi:hypothetical protein